MLDKKGDGLLISEKFLIHNTQPYVLAVTIPENSQHSPRLCHLLHHPSWQ